MKGEHWGAGDGCSGRPLIMCRGKALGGSSSLNLCNYIRGHAAEFDAWADQLGLDGWSYRDLIPHFRSAEELRGKPRHRGRCYRSRRVHVRWGVRKRLPGALAP